jgi:branched-chain amino acid transport system ATP-binding protein
MLRITSLNVSYGNIRALTNISIHVRPGEIVTLIGANGAGKSTLLNAVSGLVPAQQGGIFYGDRDIKGVSAENIVKMGISQVPEGRQVFAPLSVWDNLILGAYSRYQRKAKREIIADIDAIFGIFPILRERKKQLAGTLSGGEQQMLAIGRAMMSNPKLLLLDEPSMGLAPMIASEIFRVIVNLRQKGTTILLVEQNARAALKIADRGYVIETGRIVLEGPSDELLENREVKRAYLGKGYREVWE